MKKFLQTVFIFLLVFAGLLSITHGAYAAPPYEYDFKVGSDSFNGIPGVKNVTITFDSNLSIADQNGDGTGDESDLFSGNSNDPFYVIEKEGTKRINIIKDVTVAGRVVTVSFKNLEYLRYSDPAKLGYELKIKEGSLRFDQVADYTLPFNIYEVLPGFESIFVKRNSEEINRKIFKNNAPRDVMIHMPKMYMTGIETIHRYKGIINDEQVNEPQLTNIDVLADEEAARLKVEFQGDDQYSRDLARRTDDVEGFTMGQAGIDEITGDTLETLDEFELTAYNQYGRLLEERKFKLRVINPDSDFIVNDYITASPDTFGQAYPLYELMKDPKIMDEIIENITVAGLDRLGVIYSLGSATVKNVTDKETLEMALANPDIEVINFAANTIFAEDVIIERDVIINANSATFEGDVTIGTGDDITVRLNNATIEGALSINAGRNGTVILDLVTHNGAVKTEVISGGSNSIHLNNFTSAQGIEMVNTDPVRIVTTTEINNITVKGTGAVTLEGKFADVNFDKTNTLNANRNTRITNLTAASGEKVTIEGTGWVISNRSGEIVENGTGSLPVVAWTYPDVLTNSPDEFEEGVTLGLSNDANGDQIVDGTNWTIDASAFKTTGEFDFSDKKLKIMNLSGPASGTIILTGTNDTKIYSVTVPIDVE